MRNDVICHRKVVSETLSILREGGKVYCETVVLWLGIEENKVFRVLEVYKPQQEVDIDYFRIPPASMRELMGYLRKTRTRIVAQVHSHPRKAFHSIADDRWAILRHAGAISIVVPYFASRIDEKNFEKKVATFQLSAEDKWMAVNFLSVVRIEP